MDSRCGDRGMTGGNRELMKIADNVAGGVETVHRRLLVRVDCHIAYLCAMGAQGDSEFGTDLTSECRVQDIEIKAIPSRDSHPHTVVKAFNPNGLCDALYAGLSQRVADVRISRLVGFEEHDLSRVRPQEQRLAPSFSLSAQHADAAIHRFESITYRAEPD
jgi:hypothetical protein